MKGKSRAIKDGWWAGAVEGDISGNKSLMLRYEGDRKKAMKVRTSCDHSWTHRTHRYGTVAMGEGREAFTERIVSESRCLLSRSI